MPVVATRDRIVMGASAGGIRALEQVVAGLPLDLPAAVIVVLHTSVDSPRILPEMLARAGSLPARYAVDREVVRDGTVYVAPPDRHLVIERERLLVVRGPRENGFRPAVDPLFRSAAKQWGERVIGIVLSGALADGTYGLLTIKRSGGVAVVQDAGEAEFPSMPLSAIENVDVDHVVGAAAIGPLVNRLVRDEVDGRKRPAAAVRRDAAIGTSHALHQDQFKGPPSAFTCPDCGGALWEVTDGGVLRWQCHVGHAFTVEGLISGQDRVVEDALWTAVRALEERAALARRLALRARSGGQNAVATRFVDDAANLEFQSGALRAVLVDHVGARTARPESAARNPRRQRRPAHRRQTGVAR
jgi:two-component system chemotaxis response regulator CheB